jgi:ribosomal protein S18 acetylase RimI-like enzyme
MTTWQHLHKQQAPSSSRSIERALDDTLPFRSSVFAESTGTLSAPARRVIPSILFAADQKLLSDLAIDLYYFAFMKIRKLDASEIPDVLELWSAADSHPSITDNPAVIAALLKREYAAFLVAEIEGSIVGSIIATYDGWRGIIYRLAVHPDQRRRGIAAKLTQKAEEVLTQWGVLRVIAIVDTARPTAMAFWKTAGYTNDGMTRFYKNLQ